MTYSDHQGKRSCTRAEEEDEAQRLDVGSVLVLNDPLL
jgi:hypothetical protein